MRYPAHIPKWGIDLGPIIAYGFSVLGMSDVEIAKESCITRERDYNCTDEGREYNKERMRKYLKKISQDPVKKEKRKAQMKEWNRRAREKRRVAKESVS